MAENEIRIKDLPSAQQINETDDVIVLDNATDGTRKLQGKVLLDMIHSAMAKGTASGAVATFTDGSDGIPMTDLVVSIEPQQDLHGYDSPWVGGAGKNKLPLTVDAIKSLNTSGTWNNNTYSINGGTLTIMTDNSGNVIGLNINGTFNDSTTFHLINSNSVVFPNNQYILNGIIGGSASTYRYLYLSPSSGYLYSDGGDTLLNIDEGVSKIRLLISSGYNAQNVKVYPMVRLSSVSDSSFAPYSNICPISGWTACNVVRTGENLIDITSLTPSYAFNGISYTINSDGSVTVNGTATARSQIYWSIPQNVAKTFANKKLNGGTSQSGCSLFLELNASPYTTYATDTGLGSTISADIASATNDVNLVFRIAQGTTLSNLTIRPTIANASNTYTINFVDGSSPLTVYGGTLDVLSGLLTVDRWYAVFDGSSDENWTQGAGAPLYMIYIDGITYVGGTKNSFTNRFKSINNTTAWGTILSESNVCCITKDGNNPRFAVSKLDISTVADFKTWLSSNNLQICYKLATPQTYQLTPTQVKSLLGVNNIWADTGNILNAEYVRDTTTIINQILARLDALEG